MGSDPHTASSRAAPSDINAMSEFNALKHAKNLDINAIEEFHSLEMMNDDPIITITPPQPLDDEQPLDDLQEYAYKFSQRSFKAHHNTQIRYNFRFKFQKL
jgi:hypothetical protein